MKHLQLPAHVADAAIVHPLEGNLDPALRESILLWKQSIYGDDKTYREIVYKMREDGLGGLRSNIEALLAFVPVDYDSLPQEQRDPISRQLLPIRIAIKTHADRLMAYRNDKLQPELDRVIAQPIEIPPGNNGVMTNHLGNLIDAVNLIEKDMRLSPNPLVARRLSELINGQIELILIELRAADFDLPEQADAQEAEAEVEKAFSDLLNPK